MIVLCALVLSDMLGSAWAGHGSFFNCIFLLDMAQPIFSEYIMTSIVMPEHFVDLSIVYYF
jgi:hypothetical protein